MADAKRQAQQPENTRPQQDAFVSLKQLAAHLNLSQTTVSRVINRSPAANRIPAATQQRVFDAASLLNYKANVFASGLRSKKSFTVGVMVPEMSEGYSTMVLSGIEDALLQEGFFYFVVSHRHRQELIEGYPKLLLSRAVEGLIAIDTPVNNPLPVPVIAVSGHMRRPGVINIQLDHAKAAHYALGHLYELGHRRIAFIKGQVFSSDTKLRWKAICDVCASLHIHIDPELTVQLDGPLPGTEPGHTATLKLLARNKRFTAIFAFNDLSAIGAITALRDAGLRVPADVSVVGFDDILSAATNNPSLTTVRQPLHEMGVTAAVTLLKALRDKDCMQKHTIRVMPSFIVRESTSNVRKP